MNFDINFNVDYYEDLGVTEKASHAEIKKAFKKIVSECHPDKTSDEAAAKKFKKANDAYQILSNLSKKDMYDLKRDRVRVRFTGDIFEDIGGFETKSTRQESDKSINFEPGEDLTRHVTISLEDAYDGCKVPVQVNSGKLAPCDKCNGTGGEPGSSTIECVACHGLGRNFASGGFTGSGFKCNQCNGEKKVYLTPCKKCHGKRRINYNKEIIITIPAGVDDGNKLRISGQGSPGVNSEPGDLYIIIHIEKHELFQREGLDLTTRCWVPLKTAIHGGESEVLSINGELIKFISPKIKRSGETIVKIEGKGMENPMRRIRGDLNVIIEVIIDPNEK